MGRSSCRPPCRCAPMTARRASPRACCVRSTLSIRARYAGSWKAGSSSSRGWCALKALMSSWFWLAISALAWAGAAWSAPPQRVELAYDISRNGLRIAEVVYLLEHDGSRYQITETSKGRGVLALRGTIRRTSRGLVSPQGLKPLEFVDERTGRNTARALIDWNAKTVTQQYQGEPSVGPLPAQAHDRLAFALDFAFAPPGRGEVAFDVLNGRGQSRHVYTPGGQIGRAH